MLWSKMSGFLKLSVYMTITVAMSGIVPAYKKNL